MDKKTVNLLLSIAAACCFIAGLIFLGLSVAGDKSCIPAALASVLLGSMMNIIRTHFNKEDR